MLTINGGNGQLQVTAAQAAALVRVYWRVTDDNGNTYQKRYSWREFTATVTLAFTDCVMVPWCGMALGIETDGYTHS